MKALRLALTLVGLLAGLPAFAAPKHVIISDSLLANADRWDVKRGALWMGIHKWRFGDYAVVASTSGGTHSATRTNLFMTKRETRSGSTFAFVLCNGAADSAFVDAVHDAIARSQPGLKLGHGWTVDGDNRVRESDLFTASITLNRDTTDTWVLSVGTTADFEKDAEDLEGVGTHAAALTHGERHIVLTPVYSRKIAEHPSFGSALRLEFAPPAMGYEFSEDGQSICALEYFSSGVSGSYKNTIWMRRDTDARLRLVLAAAMTAVLEMKTAALEGAASPAEP